MDSIVTLRIILENTLPGVDYALQSGSGSRFDLVQKQVSSNSDPVFDLVVKVKGEGEPQPDFGGPYIQGNKGERFIYLGIGTYAGNPDSKWARRLKIPLRDIDWNMVNKLMTDQTLVLETLVPGRGRDGTPSCATVKPFDGWHLKSN